MVAVGAASVVGSAVVAACASDPSDVPAAAGTAPDASPPEAVGAAVPTPEASTAPAGEGETVTVQALDNTFRVQDLTVVVGTEVLFDNVGRNEHNVIPEPDSIQGWGVGEADFAPGDTYTHVFTEPGVYAYVCTIHGVKGKGMVGTITVTA